MNNAFDAFYRFFPVADDNAVLPKNLLLPRETYPVLPAVFGDFFRFLVHPADCGSEKLVNLSLAIRKKGDTGNGTLCGTIREQAGAFYTEIRLRVGSAPDGVIWKQFALMLGTTPVLGTFRSQETDIDKYVDDLAKHYENYTKAFTQVDRMGRDIRIRVFNSDAFSLSGETLTAGLGTVTTRNTNSASLMATQKSAVSFPAEDQYTLVVSPDIQKGNIFGLDTITYTAKGTEKPADILAALGLNAAGFISRPAGAVVTAYANLGTQTITNTNQPGLNALYNSTSGGNDRYTVVIGVDVQEGNVYQISASGATTKTVTASSTDTAATIAAQFNATGGFFLLPTGAVPVISVFTGTRTANNTNNPGVQLTGKVSLPIRSLDVYTIFVGNGIVEGNQFELTINGVTKSVTASSTDDPLSIAVALGYSTNPFTVQVATGVPVLAIARQGPAYHAPANVADIAVVSVKGSQKLPYVAEVTIPNLTPGIYQLMLRKYTGDSLVGGVFVPQYGAVSMSNYLHVKGDKKNTALVRFGNDRPGRVFGLAYNEDGLQQQIRLPIYVDPSPQLQQTESLYQDLNYRTVRGHAQAQFVHGLTTTMQMDAFHINLYMALKHPVLYVHGRPYRSEGEYQQTEAQGRKRMRQATAQLVELSILDTQNSAPLFDSLPNTYAQINAFAGLDGLWIVLRYLSFVRPIGLGTVFPAADYELLIRGGQDTLRVSIGQDGNRLITVLVFPNVVNRFKVRFSPGLIQFDAERVLRSLTETEPTSIPEGVAVSGSKPETSERPGDFQIDFNEHFFK